MYYLVEVYTSIFYADSQPRHEDEANNQEQGDRGDGTDVHNF